MYFCSSSFLGMKTMHQILYENLHMHYDSIPTIVRLDEGKNRIQFV